MSEQTEQNKPDWAARTRHGAKIASELFADTERELSVKEAINKAAYESHTTATMIRDYLAGVGIRALAADKDAFQLVRNKLEQTSDWVYDRLLFYGCGAAVHCMEDIAEAVNGAVNAAEAETEAE